MTEPQELTSLDASIQEAKQLYTSKLYRESIQVLEGSLSDAAAQGSNVVAELHLLLAKCYKGLDELKNAILSCNSAIDHRPHWKDPYLYRSTCFQAFQTKLFESDGDELSNIERDRSEADIIVGGNRESGEKQYVDRIEEAIALAKNSDKIFVEPGEYDVTSLFLYGKTVSLIGASTKRCILRYRRASETPKDDSADSPKESRLETFLVCTSGSVPTLIKRLTFRSANSTTVKTKFLGVAGGTVQLEDCLFDGGDSAEVGAVYTNAKICGALASSYPSPRVIARFCIFERCSSFGAFTALHSCGSLHNCYFVGCGRSCVAAMDSSKITIANCEVAMGEYDDQAIGATSSDLTITGTYIHGTTTSIESSETYAIGISLKSVANLSKNYIHRTGNGISCIDSDLNCTFNLLLGCSQRSTTPTTKPTLGLLSGISLKQKARVQLANNRIERCDVGVYSGNGAMPVIKDNFVNSSSFTGIFIESCSKPSIVGNSLDGGSRDHHGPAVTGSMGLLFLAESGGLVGKNQFENFVVAPIMVFASCHPLIRDNQYSKVAIDDEKQKTLEKSMLEQFRAELFRDDQFFYIVDCAFNEKELQDVILKGPSETTNTA